MNIRSNSSSKERSPASWAQACAERLWAASPPATADGVIHHRAIEQGGRHRRLLGPWQSQSGEAR